MCASLVGPEKLLQAMDDLSLEALRDVCIAKRAIWLNPQIMEPMRDARYYHVIEEAEQLNDSSVK